jgi:probable F420-dependent oxidoreductase
MTSVQVIPQPHLSMSLTSFAAHDPGGWTHLRDQALAYDRAGVDRLAVSDHVVFGESLDEYGQPEIGGRAGGVQPTGPDGHWLEPMTTLSYIAGITERVRLSTNILLAALRRPAVLAKSAATLDVLSGGRLDLGVGVGWQRAEYDAAGLAFSSRGQLLNHTLDVCRTLWTEQVASYESAHLSFEKLHMMPKPLQPGGVPIWVSGTVNHRVIERVVRYGSGWIPWGPAADDIHAGIRAMKAGVERAGGDPGALQVTTALPAIRDGDAGLNVSATMAQVGRLVEAGATDLRLGVRLPARRSDAVETLQGIVTAFRKMAQRDDPLPEKP